MTYLAVRRGLVLGGVALALMATAGGALAQKTYAVVMGSMSYGQIPSELKVGDTITWTNNDTVPHTVTARDRSFDLRVNPGQSVNQTLQKAGTFNFYCIYHATMRGTLVVADK